MIFVRLFEKTALQKLKGKRFGRTLRDKHENNECKCHKRVVVHCTGRNSQTSSTSTLPKARGCAVADERAEQSKAEQTRPKQSKTDYNADTHRVGVDERGAE